MTLKKFLGCIPPSTSTILPAYIIFVGCLFGPASFAQFIPYSQYYNSPLLTNPSGAALNEFSQLSVHYRRSRVANYEIPSISYVHPFYGKYANLPSGMVGVSLISENAGPSDLYNVLGGLGTFAYTVHFTKKHHVTAGLQGGIINKKIDPSAITTDNQFNLGAYDPSLAFGEEIEFNQASRPVINAGFTWTLTDTSNVQKAVVGIALSNMNKPAYRFVSDGKSEEELVYTVTGELQLFNRAKISVHPMFRYVRGTISYANLGAQVRHQLATGSISLGLWYKTTKALVTAIQFNSRNFTVATSVDFTTSSDLYAQIDNAMELFVGWHFKRAPRHQRNKV